MLFPAILPSTTHYFQYFYCPQKSRAICKSTKAGDCWCGGVVTVVIELAPADQWHRAAVFLKKSTKLCRMEPAVVLNTGVEQLRYFQKKLGMWSLPIPTCHPSWVEKRASAPPSQPNQPPIWKVKRWEYDHRVQNSMFLESLMVTFDTQMARDFSLSRQIADQ